MNIFRIEQGLQEIFDEIEENGGEITPEIEQKLQIFESNFADKLTSYVDVVNKYKSDVVVCKAEEERIKAIRKTKENVVDRLRKVMLSAVEQFGNTGKSGNKVIELPTCKLYTKLTTSYDFNLGVVNQILECLVDWLTSLWNNDMLESSLYGGFTKEDVVKAINRFYESKYPEDAQTMKEVYGELFNENDIENITIKIEGAFSAIDVAKSENWDFINTYLNHHDDALTPSNISAEPNKEVIRALFKKGTGNKYTCENKTNSLIIK